MLLDKIGRASKIDEYSLGIEEATIMEVNHYEGTVKVNIEYLRQLEELAISNFIVIKDLKSKEEGVDSLIYQLEERNKKLNDELEDIKDKTNYIDLDYEALKLVAIEKSLLARNLESELDCIKGNTEKVEYTKEQMEDMLNDYIADARNKLTNLVSEKHINSLQKIGLLEKKIRQLEIDNKILAEKAGQEVTHSERIKNGYDNVSKPEVTKEVIEELLSQKLNITEIAAQLEVTRQTIYNVLKREDKKDRRQQQ